MDNPILDALDALADIDPEDYKEVGAGVLRDFLTYLLGASDAAREELNQRKIGQAAQTTINLEN